MGRKKGRRVTGYYRTYSLIISDICVERVVSQFVKCFLLRSLPLGHEVVASSDYYLACGIS